MARTEEFIATGRRKTSVARIRMTDIVGLDAQADGGTHVRNTREVGRIVMEKADNKGKGHRRLSYHCE